MSSAVSDFVPFLNFYASSDGFAFGVAFVILMQFFGFIFELPFALRDLSWQRRISRECNLRCGGLLLDPCHYKACPAHGSCPYYKVPDRWSFFKKLFKCHK